MTPIKFIGLVLTVAGAILVGDMPIREFLGIVFLIIGWSFWMRDVG